jgi:hypothetical protein
MDSASGSGSRQKKNDPQNKKKMKKCHILKKCMLFLEVWSALFDLGSALWRPERK